MDQTRNQRVTENLTVGIIASLISTLLVGIFVALLSYFGSRWTIPAIHGALASFFTLGLSLGVMALRRMPRLNNPTTSENVEARVRDWLDKFHLSVRRLQSNDTAHFHFVVSTTAGKTIGIARGRTEWPDYLEYIAIIGPTAEEKVIIERLSEKERRMAMWEMKLELARARMGYSGFASLDGFTMFKRIPITPTLNEALVIDTVWEMEAMLNAVYAIGAKSATMNSQEASTTLLGQI